MSFGVTCPADPSDIIIAAKEIYRLLLEGVDAGTIEVYQLKKEHELKFGERIELTEMAKKLNFRSQIRNEAYLACVIPGSLFIYYCNNLHAKMVIVCLHFVIMMFELIILNSFYHSYLILNSPYLGTSACRCSSWFALLFMKNILFLFNSTITKKSICFCLYVTFHTVCLYIFRP